MVTRGRVSARITSFWNVLDEAITSITLSSTPQLIIKQRANADTVHASGLEVEASMRLSASLSATFASGFVSSTFHYCNLGQVQLPTDGTEKRHPLALRLH